MLGILAISLALLPLAVSQADPTATVAACIGITPPPGLVNWWPLDESSGTIAQDVVGGRDGATQPGAIGSGGPASVAGMVTGAFAFDGISTFVNVPDGPGTLSFGNPTDSFSIDAWVKVAPTDSSGVRPIVDKRVQIGSSISGYQFFLFNGLLGFQMADGAFTNYVSTANVADGQWHLVAVTVQRTGTAAAPPEVKLYVDGALVFTGVPRTG
ncbi:MAG: hypothetical protein HYX92_09565, partial [Chloroflexi bacterium]|nr:hypothetical protein [Chloroflexota bacterium]